MGGGLRPRLHPHRRQAPAKAANRRWTDAQALPLPGIDRCSRFVYLAVYDAENAANAVDFLRKAKRAFPFRITHILTDRGSCFTADAFEEACTQLKVPHRQTKAYTPQTNGMVERFDGRVASDVLGMNVAGHADLEILLTSFNSAYNRRRQRVLLGHSPMEKWSSASR